MSEHKRQFTVLHSSAGAGKTHALVTEYLKRVLSYHDPNGFRRVLALTFTNKAAREMAERVVEYLRELATTDATSKLPDDILSVAESLCTDLEVDRKSLHVKCGTVLKHFLHDRSSVAITTLDAFTKKVTQPFSRDLRIAFDQEMTTENVYYNGLAVEQLLDNAETKSKEILIQTCEQKVENEKGWNVKDPLNEVIELLENEEATQRLKYFHSLSAEKIFDIRNSLTNRIRRYHSQLNQAARRAESIIEQSGIPVEEFPNKNALPRFLKKLVAYKGGEMPKHIQALQSLSTGELLAKSYNGAYRDDAAALFPKLEPMLSELHELIDKCSIEETIPTAIRNELLLVATLAYLDQCLIDVKEEEGVLYFSDLTRKIARIVQEEPTPFVYERIGERYEHILIDEFQDTSILQWQNLIPLVENALANGGSAFLVGDAKQAIYRWRNGEVRQFIEFPKIHEKEQLAAGNMREQTLIQQFNEREPLADNYRSDRAIVEFNNEFFRSAAELLPPELQPVYKEHAQEVKVQRAGYVELQVLDGAEGENIDELRTRSMETVLAAINKCVELGYKRSDVALLVRTSKLGALAADFLSTHEVKVSSPDSFKLGNDPKVQLVVELLKYTDQPSDSSAARIHSLLQRMNLREDLLSKLDRSMPDVRSVADELMAEASGSQQESTLFEYIRLLTHCAGLVSSRDMMLLTLLELAHDHGRFGVSGLRSFLEAYERQYWKQGVQLALDENAVRIMTVHQSKGLGIPVVIIPFAEMKSGGNQSTPLWINAEEYGLKHALVQHSKALEEAGVPEAEEESGLETLDNTNLLYVACTRAKNRLVVIGQNPKRGGKSDLVKELIEFVRAHGTESTYRTGNADEPARPPKGIAENLAELMSSETEGLARVVYRKEAPNGWMADDPDPYRTHGDLVHALFERIAVIDDLDKAMEWASAVNPLPDELPDRLRGLFAKPEIQTLYDPRYKSINECAVILNSGRTIRPDRVVFRDDSVDVLDIKTGDRSKQHAKQVQGYMQALKELGYQQVNGHILYVKEQRLEAV